MSHRFLEDRGSANDQSRASASLPKKQKRIRSSMLSLVLPEGSGHLHFQATGRPVKALFLGERQRERRVSAYLSDACVVSHGDEFRYTTEGRRWASLWKSTCVTGRPAVGPSKGPAREEGAQFSSRSPGSCPSSPPSFPCGSFVGTLHFSTVHPTVHSSRAKPHFGCTLLVQVAIRRELRLWLNLAHQKGQSQGFTSLG